MKTCNVSYNCNYKLVANRYYNPRISLFYATDPLAEKYPNFSPYTYTADNPVMLTDPDGKDFIVLNYGYTEDPEDKKNHIVGHQAVLIGNDKDGWYYYSYDADYGVNGRSNKKNVSDNDNFTAGVYFKSIEDFAKSEHNTFKDDYDDGEGLDTSHKDKDGKIIQRYQRAYRIKTSKEADVKMKKAANTTFDKTYKLLINDCTAVPRNALRAGGLKDGEFSAAYPQNIVLEKNWLPVTKQEEIERSNEGTDVSEQLNR